MINLRHKLSKFAKIFLKICEKFDKNAIFRRLEKLHSIKIKGFGLFWKIAQKIAIFFGLFDQEKNRQELWKRAQMARNRPIWSHWRLAELFL